MGIPYFMADQPGAQEAIREAQEERIAIQAEHLVTEEELEEIPF